MLIEQAILDELIGTSGVTDLVGTRIYYVKAPQNVTTPYVVFTKVSAPREHDHDGSAGLVGARFQFSVFAKTYYETKQIAVQIQTVLQAYSGTMGEVVVNGAFYQNEVDFWEEDTKLYHVACDYLIWYNE